MKKVMILMLVVIAASAVAMAQIQPPTSDVLGAHLNYGRGCAACHAPHSGAWGNGANKSGDTTAGNVALWGQDVGNLFGKTIIDRQHRPRHQVTSKSCPPACRPALLM